MVSKPIVLSLEATNLRFYAKLQHLDGVGAGGEKALTAENAEKIRRERGENPQRARRKSAEVAKRRAQRKAYSARTLARLVR
jgi:hypothetical protein